MRLSASLPRISTNVRFAFETSFQVLARRIALRTSAAFSPDLAGAWAERLFLTPPKPRYPAASALDLIDARAQIIEHKRRSIATWEWGWRDRHAPAVLLAHGWGGNAAQMRPFVHPLLAAGYRVIAFDQPAHGVSGGRVTGLPDFADVLKVVTQRSGETAAVIAHSLGAAAAAFALARGLPARRVVLIGASLDVFGYSRNFARWYWMPEGVRTAMEAAIEERFGVPWSELDMARLAPRITAEALVIHDRNDRMVPWRKGQAFARHWRGARFLTTRGLGHARILADDGVVRAATDFIVGRSSVAGPAHPPLPQPAPIY
jgi:pimeloyl-ACP methyl ester carboxylesterase